MDAQACFFEVDVLVPLSASGAQQQCVEGITSVHGTVA